MNANMDYDRLVALLREGVAEHDQAADAITKLRADLARAEEFSRCSVTAGTSMMVERDQLRAERDDFYSDYRMKCDKETKALTVERNALVTELIAVEDERDVFAALLRECREDWIRLAYGASHEDVAAYRDFATRIDAALAKDKP